MTLADVAAVVRGYRFTYATEADLHHGIFVALTIAGFAVEREYHLPGSAGRIDLLVDERIGVEVKIQGSRHTVEAQLVRYLEELEAVVLVTGKASHSTIALPNLEVVSLVNNAL